MIFQFIKYTQPGWQFNLVPKVEGPFASCYPGPVQIAQWGGAALPGSPLGESTKSGLPEAALYDEQMDEGFETETARLGELGYRLWNKGYLLESAKNEITAFHQMQPPSLKDEYRFVRKYWGGAWTFYAYLRRLCGFHNIFKETNAFLQTRNVQRINPYHQPIERNDYEAYESALVHSAPLVAVIIPTLNRYAYLKDVLHDLEAQEYRNFEVIVVDQSDPYDADFYEQFQLKLTLIRQKERLLWTARNRAIAATESEFLLFFDDDSRVAPDWIWQHLKCLDYFEASISAGVSLATLGQKVSASYGYFRWADQFDSGNAMVRRSVFEQIGYFDELFNGQRMGDAEFGIRAYIHGLRNISNPRASRVHLKAGSGGLREMGYWDGFRTEKWFAPKPVPSVVYLLRKYYPAALADNALVIGMMLSNVGFKNKNQRGMLMLSILLTIIKSPILYIQYKKSAAIAATMLAHDSANKW